MLRPLPDLPSGVIGFEAVGEVHSDDYRDVLRPAVDSAAAAGPVRFVYVLGPEFTGYSAGASWEDTKLGFEHMRAWERTAVVTDVEWVEHVVSAFGWMVPGEFRRFPVAERDAAIRWAAGIEAPSAPEPEPVPEAPSAPEPAPVPVSDATSPGAEAAPQPVPPGGSPAVAPGASVVPAPPAVPEQWAPDPSGRHQHRWWNGREWTEHVADNGVSAIDPIR